MPVETKSDAGNLLSQFALYSAAGAIGTAAHYLVLVTLVQGFLFNAVLASIDGSIAGAGINYLLSYHCVFRSQKRHIETATKFIVIGGIGLVLNAMMMFLMDTLAGIHYLVSQVITTCIVLLWNFSGNRFWTFAHEPKQDNHRNL